MEPELSLRDATTDDATVIAEIYNDSIRAGDANMDEGDKSPGDVRRQMEGFHSRETFLVLERGPEVVGWGIIKRYSERAGYRYACETAVYLRRDAVGRGYGSRIKRALITRCREYGYRHLVAKIMARNTASIEYNKKLGYETVGVQKEIGYRDGRWVDIVILQLVLDDVAPGGGAPAVL